VTDAAAARAASLRLPRREALARVIGDLRAAGLPADEAQADARALLFAAARLSHADYVMSPEGLLLAEDAARLAYFAARRAAREPVSRILGTRGFWTLDLAVAEDVLDPRADTETLVEAALEQLGARRREPLAILDLGSGSGAILCALLAESPLAVGIAVDLSERACAATRANIARCGLDARAFVLRGRWGRALSARFDLIVSNPPYIPSADIAGLAPEVRDHDPKLALDGGADGLDAYREIARAAPRLLAAEGLLALEFGIGQANDVTDILRDAGLAPIALRRDCGGRERAIVARRAA
jgi:release factor glutamine methyltransferase